jgi:S-formylglutathione hydrolase FrmB
MAGAALALFWAVPVSANDRITFAEVPSVALGRSLPVTIVTPAVVTPASAVPVLFFLHGRGRHHRSLIDEPAARAAFLAAPFYTVMPQGEDGWYIDSPARPADRYATYLAEVVAWAERNLPIASDAARRGLAGWSMGGYGAVRFAQTNPGGFGFVASVIGLLDFPRTETLPVGQNYTVPIQRFTADPAVWATFNPIHSITALRDTTLTLVLATRGFELTMNESFLAALASADLPPPRVHRLEGGHQFPLVIQAVPLVLADAAATFARSSVVSKP